MATVLVVEDEFGIADVLETILTDKGYRVLTACNGQQGLARLAEEKPDLILLDFMMPILNGAGVLRAMTAEPAYHRIPVIMMSALEEDMIAKNVAATRRSCGSPSKPSPCWAPLLRSSTNGKTAQPSLGILSKSKS